MVDANILGLHSAATGTDREINYHSPLRAGDHFDMGDEPIGSGVG